MSFIESIIKRAKENRKKIVLPETMDDRIYEAAKEIVEKDICDIVLVGKNEEIKEHSLKINLDLSKVEVIDVETSELTGTFTDKLYELRREKGMTKEEANRLLKTDYMYYACMLVKEGYADGAVSGACHSTANTLRPALQIIKTKPSTNLVSSFFLMSVPNCEFGDNGIFVFSDCGLEPNPTSEKLVYIAKDSADSFKLLTDHEPVTAFLSYSTMGSASSKDPNVGKVVEAVKMAKEIYPEYKMDGEMQLDAAIVPNVAVSKAPESEVAGCANVLIFPELSAGNIGYKLVQRLAKAEAYGPMTQGINYPVNDLSRGCSSSDIVGVVAITCVQAIATTN